jgi:glycosyltransferase involved in cell wall biosynthesis
MCTLCALPASKILGIPLINGYLRDAPEALTIRDTEYRRARITFPFSDRVLSNSHAGLDAYNAPQSKKICIHNGFNFSRLQGIESKEQVREKFGITTRYVVGMVAAFSARKDYATFFNAANIILNNRNDVTFVTAGDGNDLPLWKERIGHERVMFLGRQPHVMNIVNAFDIGVLSAFREGISNSVMEYMALRKPVVAADCRGNRELIEDGRTGFIVEPGNPGQLAEKIAILLSDEGLSKAFGMNGYDKLKKEFSLESMGREYLKLYRGLARKRRP